MSDYTPKLKRVQKWEKDLKVKLDKVIQGVVTKVKCALCMIHADSIKNLKSFSEIWIDGSNLAYTLTYDFDVLMYDVYLLTYL